MHADPAARPSVTEAPVVVAAAPASVVAAAYAAHAPELHAYVLARFRGNVAAEDVVQEAFARLVREVAAGRAPDAVRPWLYRVAHNLAVSELRGPGRREAELDVPGRPEPRAASAEAELESWSLDGELQAALGTLSPAARRSVLMAADGYTSREIASAVGRTELASRALLCRARRSLRELLAGTELAGARDARRAAGPQLAA
ncbi:MAG: sigma-70 family RNA polymerase sigma factor [Chloroflexi bacterium]|jgi:RNA polymerase sigma-70 factor (ECF subfamily)|nr:sigma-70 family RNA polymerase sigma factor [Chloroflexota bacterium]